jgi:hypothetical protein
MSVEPEGVVEIVPVVSVTALIVVFVALVICPCAFTAMTGTTKDEPYVAAETPVTSILIVPVEVIGPPVSPVPVATDVTPEPDANAVQAPL